MTYKKLCVPLECGMMCAPCDQPLRSCVPPYTALKRTTAIYWTLYALALALSAPLWTEPSVTGHLHMARYAAAIISSSFLKFLWRCLQWKQNSFAVLLFSKVMFLCANLGQFSPRPLIVPLTIERSRFWLTFFCCFSVFLSVLSRH